MIPKFPTPMQPILVPLLALPESIVAGAAKNVPTFVKDWLGSSIELLCVMRRYSKDYHNDSEYSNEMLKASVAALKEVFPILVSKKPPYVLSYDWY